MKGSLEEAYQIPPETLCPGTLSDPRGDDSITFSFLGVLSALGMISKCSKLHYYLPGSRRMVGTVAHGQTKRGRVREREREI